MDNHDEQIKFVWEQADKLAPGRRAKLYRWLADICGNDQMAVRLLSLAVATEEAEKMFREFGFTNDGAGNGEGDGK